MLGDPAVLGLQTGIENAIVAAPDHTWWVGANASLVHLLPATGQVIRYSVPAGSDSAAAEAARPQAIKGIHAVHAMAVDSAGRVAVASSATAAVPILQNGTQTGMVKLPDQTEPTTVAFSTRGTLAVGLMDFANHGEDEILLHRADGSESLVHAVVHGLAGDGADFLATASETGTVTRIHDDGTLQVTTIPRGTAPFFTGAGIPVAGPYMIVPTTAGLLVFNSDTSASKEFVLPKYECSDASAAIPGAAPTGGTVRCSQAPTTMTVDASGTVWFLSTGPDNVIHSLSRSSYA